MKDVRHTPFRPAPNLIPKERINKLYKYPKCNSDEAALWLDIEKILIYGPV